MHSFSDGRRQMWGRGPCWEQNTGLVSPFTFVQKSKCCTRFRPPKTGGGGRGDGARYPGCQLSQSIEQVISHAVPCLKSKNATEGNATVQTHSGKTL